ncbi:chloride channel [Vararia minispora EC-137]|uniref:Chloride channel n=1 Tax=Vararia minispora EC-137 TaxID=1314806 RepID=A0ACB8QU97_9AGAM|nr:chloride channel [Vararia minispora EC-137]
MAGDPDSESWNDSWDDSPWKRQVYQEGETIDWWSEDAVERDRWKQLFEPRGLRGVLAPVIDASKIWFVVVFTGIGVGLAGGWLDVLVKWLSDLREGRCTYGFFYNSVTCCSSTDAGQVCFEWRTWSNYLNLHSLFGSSLLQAFVYIALSVALAASSALLVVTYAPYAFHTGIPEIKAILGGYVFDSVLSAWTLLIKLLGLALSVSSGLSLGKEGPLVHVACCLAYLLSRFFKQFRENEAQKRRVLASAAAAGVSVAFGSPLGGVLFALEELDTFANESDVLWRGFVTSVIAAVALQYVDPFGTSKLVLFQVTNSGGGGAWLAFELAIISTASGILGHILLKLNAAISVYRRNGILHDMPIVEVTAVTAVTAAISYLVVFLRVQSSELVANLFQECDPTKGDFHGLCNSTATHESIFLLILTAFVKLGFTAWTFGMMVPAGIFLPTITIGACLGRAVGLMTQELQRVYPKAWIFSACPPDPTVRCVYPGFYAVIGASAMLGGVTRMTISLVVIVFELTGALSHVLPIMIAVMVAKWVGDAFGQEGIYPLWIAMRRYTWLPPVEYHDSGETAGQFMTPTANLVVVENGTTLEELGRLAMKWEFAGFPVVDNKKFIGYVTRANVREHIEPLLEEPGAGNRKCSFWLPATSADVLDLSGLVEDAMHLQRNVPLELAVNMFQKLNLRHIMFTEGGELKGMMTKTDVATLITAQMPVAGATAVHVPSH